MDSSPTWSPRELKETKRQLHEQLKKQIREMNFEYDPRSPVKLKNLNSKKPKQ